MAGSVRANQFKLSFAKGHLKPDLTYSTILGTGNCSLVILRLLEIFWVSLASQTNSVPDAGPSSFKILSNIFLTSQRAMRRLHR